MKRLTKLERVMLRQSAEFVLAGEWPFESSEDRYEVERAALQSAFEKLSEVSS